MSAMAAAPPPAPHLDSVLSFSALASHAAAEPASSDSDSDSDLEFAFAPPPPLSPRAGAHALAPADDLFAHGRIVPAYPLAGHGHDEALASSPAPTSSSAAPPPSPDTYCAWAPRDAPAAFPKSASTGTEARRSWRLRDLVAAGGGRSRSDGKDKFAFLQPTSSASPAASGGDGGGSKHASAKAAAPPQKHAGKKKKNNNNKKAGATEMDMATAHRLFYGKPGAAALAGDRTRQPQQQSYLPYRPGIVGFFATAHALGRSHNPY